jgi:hypothetical protein
MNPFGVGEKKQNTERMCVIKNGKHLLFVSL